MFTKNWKCVAALSVLVAMVVAVAPARATVVLNSHFGWTGWGDITTGDLLLSPTTLQSAVYTGSDWGYPGGYGVDPTTSGVLTDGLLTPPTSGDSSTRDGNIAQYNLNTSLNTSGYNITAIKLYAQWGDDGWTYPRGTVKYQLVGNPTWQNIAVPADFPPSLNLGGGKSAGAHHGDAERRANGRQCHSH